GFGHEFHLRSIELKIAGTKRLSQHQVRHIETELRWNFRRQSVDFQFTSDGLEHTALHLDALRLAQGVYWHLHAHADVHSDTQQIHVKQISADGIDLPILHDRRLLFSAERHLKQ